MTNGTVGMEQQTAPSVSSVDRTFKDRLIDQVNQGGSLGGSIDSSGEKKEEKKEEGSPTSR